MINISIITPTFNRKSLVSRSIDSSLKLKNIVEIEIIVIDDNSTDGTEEIIKSKYAEEINTGLIKFNRLNKNIGVTGARNKGIEYSSGEWLVFMDSDDYFPQDCLNFLNEVKNKNEYDILFFRCCDKNNKLIGQQELPNEITFKKLLNNGTPGECLPVIKKSAFAESRYKEYLRGGEAITYLEMLSIGKKAYISDIIARVYDDSSENRLCNKHQLKKRTKQLIRFNILKLKFVKDMKLEVFIATMSRIIYYSLLHINNFIISTHAKVIRKNCS